MKKGVKSVRFILIVSIALGTVLIINYFRVNILGGYASMYVSSSIQESKKENTLICEYDVELIIDDSTQKTAVMGAVESVWVEHMWGYFPTVLFSKKKQVSKKTYLVIRHPEEYTRQTFSRSFDEYFFSMDSVLDWNLSQKQQIIEVDSEIETLYMNIYRHIPFNFKPLYVGKAVFHPQKDTL